MEFELCFVRCLAERTYNFEIAYLLKNILVRVVLILHRLNQIQPSCQLLSFGDCLWHILVDTFTGLNYRASIIMEITPTFVNMAKNFLRQFSF